MRLINWPASSITWSKLDRLMMKPSLPNSKLVTKNVACRSYKLKHDKWVTPLCRRMRRRTPDTQFLKRGLRFGCFATFIEKSAHPEFLEVRRSECRYQTVRIYGPV